MATLVKGPKPVCDSCKRLGQAMRHVRQLSRRSQKEVAAAVARRMQAESESASPNPTLYFKQLSLFETGKRNFGPEVVEHVAAALGLRVWMIETFATYFALKSEGRVENFAALENLRLTCSFIEGTIPSDRMARPPVESARPQAAATV